MLLTQPLMLDYLQTEATPEGRGQRCLRCNVIRLMNNAGGSLCRRVPSQQQMCAKLTQQTSSQERLLPLERGLLQLTTPL